MHCRFLRWCLILPAVIALTSCSSDTPEQSIENPSQASNDSIEQPIDVIVKRGSRSGNQAPGPIAPVVDAPAAIPVGPAVSAPPVPIPPPPPVGVVVDDTCEDIFCGDGHKQDGEECDDGNDDESDNCDNFCRKIRCGNNRVEGEEECDNPDHLGCTEDCTLNLCGNGKEDPGETCDPPNDTNCNANCLESVCGNGIVELGEECDDDNAVETDGCNSECELACGNAVP